MHSKAFIDRDGQLPRFSPLHERVYSLFKENRSALSKRRVSTSGMILSVKPSTVDNAPRQLNDVVSAQLQSLDVQKYCLKHFR